MPKGKQLSTSAIHGRLDCSVQRILTSPDILAWIFRFTVCEFEECPIDVIKKCILQGMDHQPQPVEEGGDRTLTEGTALFDAVLRVSCPPSSPVKPRTAGSEKFLLINLGIQLSEPSDYCLESLASMRCARMEGAQLAKLNTSSSYDESEKCYSIWICISPRKEWEGTHAIYSVKRTQVSGQVNPGNLPAPGNFNKAVFSIVRMKKCTDEKDEPLFRFLDLLFGTQYSYQTRTKLLEELFDIRVDDTVANELKKMGQLPNQPSLVGA